MTRSSRRRSLLWLSAALSILCVGGSFSIVADLQARDGDASTGAESNPLETGDVRAIQHALETESVVGYVSQQVDIAFEQSVETLGCTLLDHGLTRARRDFEQEHYQRAQLILRTMVARAHAVECVSDEETEVGPPSERTPLVRAEGPVSPPPDRRETIAMGRLLRSRALLEMDRPRQALDLLERVDSTPIGDYVRWLRARAHDAAGDSPEAASHYAQVYQNTSTPLKFRARARQITALVEAERWSEVLPMIEEMLETFPDYPRRAQMMYHYGLVLEHLGRFQEAARAYRETWLEFPHKPSGDRAISRLDTLRLRGVRVAEPSKDTLFDHYSDLRRNKHWKLAEHLLHDLLDRAERDGDRKLEHRILMQLGLNAYIPKRNREALRYFRQLDRAYEAGHRRGIDIQSVSEYLGRTYARLGQRDRAVEHLERAFRDEGHHERKREMAEFFMGFGEYERARKLFDSYFSEWRKRRWTYTWLLYKTERFEEAYEHLMHIAEHHHGRREARALYWAARTREHQDKPRDAATLFEQVEREFARTYYGFQASNRLIDLKQRRAVDGAMAKRADALVDSSDQVLDELDNAADAMEGRSVRDEVDSRLVPRRAPSTPEERTASRCRPGDDTNSQFCHLLSGRIPEPTLDVLERALSPGYAPRALRSGLHAFHIRPPRSPSGTEARTRSASAEDPRDRHSRRSGVGTTSRSMLSYHTEARIYWAGRHQSEVAFMQDAEGEAIGPMPERPLAYDDNEYVGGLSRAVEAAGELFPELERAQWLDHIGMEKGARRAIRDVALEFEALTDEGAPDDEPHELSHQRWTYLIDHRRDGKGYWGYQGEDVPRYPVPDGREARDELVERQSTIVDREETLRPILTEAMMEVGEYHLVRQWTLDHQSGWFDRDPSGPARIHWTRAYPRAFPEMVLETSREHGVNPYLIWSLMAVESAYNPDSISYAEAIGLLQVIPRTSIKVAEWLGDEDFSPYDLIEPETAISQGTSYFSSLVDKFHRQELFAVAGYNGGPHRVALWLERRGDLPFDEFVETIPFTQTRRYVKKVTRYLGIYLRLYEGRDSLYIGQNIDASYRPHPNF